MIKDPMLVLTEAMELDTTDFEETDDDPVSKEIEDVETVEESILYTEEMIPVFHTSKGYVVELDLLQKLIESKKIMDSYCDEEKALSLLKEHNHLNEDIGVIIESESTIKTNLSRLKDQFKKEKNPKNKAIIKKRIDDTADLIKKLKARGKVVKKK